MLTKKCKSKKEVLALKILSSSCSIWENLHLIAKCPLLLYEQIVPLKNIHRPLFQRASREANLKSRRLFPFVKLAKKHEGVHVNLKFGSYSNP